ncbi:major facilitator superfamily domain-containing protein [Armillaria borealis]|uniref:Major facilitator superfamily domain-containing protein n=1 Tax=Armillaria borealis TaxID=47425 RepID=A0AA39K796_9AGAR|nr:major facilitator superfamily domain-containing protein [Armillaria borealis]
MSPGSAYTASVDYTESPKVDLSPRPDSLEAGKEKLEDVIDPVFERKTMRWVDIRMLPLLALLYSVALVDRLNISVARTAGMGEALGLDVGSRYSIATCMYFIPYVLFQVPGNILLRKIGARVFLSFIVTAWGAAGLFPALVYIISTWYTRHEVAKRLAAFYMISLTIAGFAPILAYCISLLDGKRGIAGWSWIFIIEGALTIFLGIITYLYVPDFPDKNRFLTPEQTAVVLRRIEIDRGDSVPDVLTPAKIWFHLKDWSIWTYAYFISIILGGMGYGRSMSLLLSAPPYGPARFANHMPCGTLRMVPNNVVSQSKRSVQTALTSGCAGIGGIIASTVFREKDFPKYVPGLWVTIGTQIVLIGVVLVTVIHFSRLNRLMREGKLKEPIQGQPGFYHTL